MSQEDAENVVDPQETDADQQDNEETPVEGEIKEGEEVEEKTQQIRCLIENSQVRMNDSALLARIHKGRSVSRHSLPSLCGLCRWVESSAKLA